MGDWSIYLKKNKFVSTEGSLVYKLPTGGKLTFVFEICQINKQNENSAQLKIKVRAAGDYNDSIQLPQFMNFYFIEENGTKYKIPISPRGMIIHGLGLVDVSEAFVQHTFFHNDDTPNLIIRNANIIGDHTINVGLNGRNTNLSLRDPTYSIDFYFDTILPPSSKLTFNSTAYLGEPLLINVKRPSGYTQDIELRLPTGSDSIKLFPIIANSSLSQVTWNVSDTLGTYFPNSKTLAAEIACYDKNSSGKVVASKQYPITLALNKDLAVPTVQMVVKDINNATTALTGDEKVLITNQSKAQYTITATPKYGATIKSYSIQNGDTILSTATGIIDKPFSGEFTVLVTDSRGYQAAQKITTPVIEYRNPTITLSNNKPDVDGNYIVDTSGMWFSGSFGKESNTLTIQYRMKERDSSVEGEWITIPQSKQMLRTLLKWYSIYTVTGLDYRKTYVFQTRAIDKLTIVYSSTKTVKALPVFDWSEDEVNFNVPVAMKETQVLDINEDTKDVILSGGGELIHIRPRGKGSSLRELTVGGDQLLYNGKPIEGGTKTPIATTSTPGIVKPDGNTIKVTADGTISAAGGGGGKTERYVNPTSVPLANGAIYFFYSPSPGVVYFNISIGGQSWGKFTVNSHHILCLPCFQRTPSQWIVWNQSNGWVQDFPNPADKKMLISNVNGNPLDVYVKY